MSKLTLRERSVSLLSAQTSVVSRYTATATATVLRARYTATATATVLRARYTVTVTLLRAHDAWSKRDNE
jgi:hypothetical protein